MDSGPICELKIKGTWQAITLDQALRLDKGRLMRCPECHGRVRAHSAGRDGMSAHFEHRENNPGCYLGYNFDGVKRKHRKSEE